MRTSTTNISSRAVRLIVTLVIGIIGLLLIFAFARQHFYIFRQVDVDQVGVMKRGGQIFRVVPSGLYTDVALFAELQTYSTSAFHSDTGAQEIEIIRASRRRK